MKNYCLISGKSLQILIVLILIAVALFSPTKTFADCDNNFVDIEVAKIYLQRNPYIIAFYNNIKGQSSHLFKVEQVYMDEGLLTVSGPEILSWKENEYRQRTYMLPDSAQVFTDELCGNYHYGYYKPMRAAFPLADIFGLTGGDVNYVSDFLAFPGPDVIPVVEKAMLPGWNSCLK